MRNKYFFILIILFFNNILTAQDFAASCEELDVPAFFCARTHEEKRETLPDWIDKVKPTIDERAEELDLIKDLIVEKSHIEIIDGKGELNPEINNPLLVKYDRGVETEEEIEEEEINDYEILNYQFWDFDTWCARPNALGFCVKKSVIIDIFRALIKSGPVGIVQDYLSLFANLSRNIESENKFIYNLILTEDIFSVGLTDIVRKKISKASDPARIARHFGSSTKRDCSNTLGLPVEVYWQQRVPFQMVESSPVPWTTGYRLKDTEDNENNPKNEEQACLLRLNIVQFYKDQLNSLMQNSNIYNTSAEENEWGIPIIHKSDQEELDIILPLYEFFVEFNEFSVQDCATEPDVGEIALAFFNEGIENLYEYIKEIPMHQMPHQASLRGFIHAMYAIKEYPLELRLRSAYPKASSSMDFHVIGTAYANSLEVKADVRFNMVEESKRLGLFPTFDTGSYSIPFTWLHDGALHQRQEPEFDVPVPIFYSEWFHTLTRNNWALHIEEDFQGEVIEPGGRFNCIESKMQRQNIPDISIAQSSPRDILPFNSRIRNSLLNGVNETFCLTGASGLKFGPSLVHQIDTVYPQKMADIAAYRGLRFTGGKDGNGFGNRIRAQATEKFKQARDLKEEAENIEKGIESIFGFGSAAVAAHTQNGNLANLNNRLNELNSQIEAIGDYSQIGGDGLFHPITEKSIISGDTVHHRDLVSFIGQRFEKYDGCFPDDVEYPEEGETSHYVARLTGYRLKNRNLEHYELGPGEIINEEYDFVHGTRYKNGHWRTVQSCPEQNDCYIPFGPDEIYF